MAGLVGNRSELRPSARDIAPRNHPRLRVRIPARLISLDGFLPATILDLSHKGARLRTFRPVSFREAAVQWLDYEAFGRVAWQRQDICGITFEDQLPVRCLMDTRNVPAELAMDLFPDEPAAPPPPPPLPSQLRRV